MKKYAVGQPIRIASGFNLERNFDGWVVASTRTTLRVITSSIHADLYELKDNNLLPSGTWTVEVRPGKPAKVIAEKRKDGFLHFGVVVGRRVIIVAGCRSFKGVVTARKHWNKRQRNWMAYDREHKYFVRGQHKPFYPTPQAHKLRATNAALNKWSLAFVRKVERLTAKK